MNQVLQLKDKDFFKMEFKKYTLQTVYQKKI